jgi:transcriptional regulator with XRE-family HTH domain
MAKKFAELEARMSQEALARSDAKANRLTEEMALNELRAALEITQEQLAGLLNVNQAAISKIERRTDMYVSTLASVIRAMGGELEIHARFPEGRVKIKQFRDLTAPKNATKREKAKRRVGV